MTIRRERDRRQPMAQRGVARGTLPRTQVRDVHETGLRARRRRPLGFGWLLVLGLLALFVIFVLPAVFGAVARSMAEGNPDLLRVPFFADAVRDGGIDDRLDRPAGDDATPIEVTIPSGSSARAITDLLVERGVVADRLAFSWILIAEGAGRDLKAGSFTLDRTMTPRQVVAALQQTPPPPAANITVALREGLRIEQVTAYLQLNADEMPFSPADFFALASEPPAELIADYPMLSTLPAGRSLEGYLGSGVFQIVPDTTAEEFLRILLDLRAAELGPLIDADRPAMLESFYEVLTLASIVESEATLPEERPTIAGVFLNRLDRDKWFTRLLNADPTVLYGNDTVNLRSLPIEEWDGYTFWAPPGQPMAQVRLDDDLFGYQTYRSRGLPPGPIRSPTVGSVMAVLQPDLSHDYLYFVAKNDGSSSHAFAETPEQHQANIDKYVHGNDDDAEDDADEE